MPFEFSDHTSNTSMFYLRIDVSGKCDVEDGQAFEAMLMRPEHLCPKVLSVVAAGTEYSPELRKLFPGMVEKYSAVAAVVTSAIVRAAINLMVRLTKQHGGPVRMFKTEDEAMQWLEQRP